MGHPVKFIITIVGILITISGYYLENGERYPWLIDRFAPRYHTVLQIYETMLDSALSARMPGGSEPKIIKFGDPGFAEMVEILSADFPEITANPKSVEQLRIKETGYMAGYIGEKKLSYAGIRPYFELTLKDGKVLSKYLIDLRPEIRKRFLEEPLFTWGTRVFWIGILITLVSVFI